MNVTILKKFTAIISAGIVALSTTVPVFASNQSVGPIDYDVIEDNNFNGNIYISQASWVLTEDSNEIIVPVYYRFTNLSNSFRYAYLSGFFAATLNLNIFGVDVNSPTNVSASYFEGINDPTLHVSWTTSYSLRVYLDNFRVLDNPSWNANILLGYMHYSYNPPATPYTFTFPTALNQVNVNSATQVVGTAYEYGCAEAVAYAIANAPTTQDALDILLNINQDTGYLVSVYTILNRDFPNILNMLSTIDQDVYSIYTWLINQSPSQSEAAGAIEDEVNQKASQSAVLSNDMAVDKPQLSGDDVNITGLIDTSVNNQFTGFLGALVQNNFITTMFLIALSCMIIGFVLYGKK